MVYGDDSAAPPIDGAEFADGIIAMQRHQTAAGPKNQKCSAAGCSDIKPSKVMTASFLRNDAIIRVLMQRLAIGREALALVGERCERKAWGGRESQVARQLCGSCSRN